MDLQDFAAIAEIIGIAIIGVTFLFLGLQIRQANRIAMGQMSLGMTGSELTVTSSFLAYARVWDMVLNDEPIEDPVDRRQAIILLNQFFANWDNRFRQMQLGFMDPKDFEESAQPVRFMVNLAMFEEYKKAPAWGNRLPEFRDYLESLKD